MNARRLQIVFLSGLVFVGLIVVRLIHLQVFMGYDYARRAFRSHYRRVDLSPQRGVIWDRHHRLLAVSLASDSLCADPYQIGNPEEVARQLAQLLPCTYGETVVRLKQSHRRFTWLYRNLSPAQSSSIQNLNTTGLFFRKELRRFYPAGEETAVILGFTGVDGTGLEGLEAMHNRRLAGSPGEELIAVDALARPYSPERIILSEPEPGQDLHLTLDKSIQFFAASELKKAVELESARWGAVVVMDVHTGEILAMASEPTFNPHRFQGVSRESRRNRCTSQLIEPGSAFKAITLASALEADVIDLHETINCENGHITLGNHTFSDWKTFQTLSVEDVIVFSSNVGTIKIAQRVGGELLRQFACHMGLGSTVVPELPGSEPGYVREVPKWTPAATASLSIGYGIAVTPLQLATVYAAFANGGWRIQPRIVMDAPVAPPIRVMTPQTASQVANVLIQTVSRGTAKNADPENYRAAGKTGTARWYDHEQAAYDPSRVTCVFTGFAPAESPMVSVCVVIDDPQKQKWSSQVTANLFSRIVDRTLLYLGEPPQRKVAV